MREAAGDDRYAWSFAGSRRLKGISSEVRTFRARQRHEAERHELTRCRALSPVGAMALLMIFALVAGAGTALSPCVLPVLPAVLSAGVTGGRRRPLGVVTGIVVVVHVRDRRARLRDRRARPAGRPGALDRDRDARRVRRRAAGPAARRPGRGVRQPARPGPGRAAARASAPASCSDSSLGLVYAPCAGPILAGVITVSPRRTSPRASSRWRSPTRSARAPSSTR